MRELPAFDHAEDLLELLRGNAGDRSLSLIRLTFGKAEMTRSIVTEKARTA